MVSPNIFARSDAYKDIDFSKAFDGWVDLVTCEDADVRPFEPKLISLGVKIDVPEGYVACMRPKPGKSSIRGIMMTVGVAIYVKNFRGFKDIWHFTALAIRDSHIPAGTHICEFRLVKKEELTDFVPADFFSTDGS